VTVNSLLHRGSLRGLSEGGGCNLSGHPCRNRRGAPLIPQETIYIYIYIYILENKLKLINCCVSFASLCIFYMIWKMICSQKEEEGGSCLCSKAFYVYRVQLRDLIYGLCFCAYICMGAKDCKYKNITKGVSYENWEYYIKCQDNNPSNCQKLWVSI
jgi:hypothetical protein